jgi:carbon monoxide dehydrogenase subunit G
LARFKIVSAGNKTPDEVWKIISDLENEPRYWKGTKKILSMQRDGTNVTREVMLAFRNSVAKEKITFHNGRKIVIELVDGPILGTKTISVEEDEAGAKLTTVWDVKFRGGLALLSPLVTRHIRKGTEAAHSRILS